jgi:uroporphyrinogen decarboxylase
MKKIVPHEATPFVAESLAILRKTVGPSTAVLGFVGCPYTLATYLVEGGSSKDFIATKSLMLSDPKLMHAMLSNVAESIGEYACFQVESGAQIIQVFDSWAGSLSARDYDEFALPYQRIVINAVKERYPEVPVIIYIKQSGALLERMADTGADVVSLDWTVDVAEGRARLDNKAKKLNLPKRLGVQGNLDPMILLAGSDDDIRERTLEIIRRGSGKEGGHVMNLGHGIEATTDETKAKVFIDTCKEFRY